MWRRPSRFSYALVGKKRAVIYSIVLAAYSPEMQEPLVVMDKFEHTTQKVKRTSKGFFFNRIHFVV